MTVTVYFKDGKSQVFPNGAIFQVYPADSDFVVIEDQSNVPLAVVPLNNIEYATFS